MKKEKIRMKLEQTAKGYFGLWEWGGGFTNTGDATIICNNDGSKKKAIYIKRRGHLANESHALVVVNIGDYVINLFRRRKEYVIIIYKIIDFIKEEYTIEDGRVITSWYALLEEEHKYDSRIEEIKVPQHLKEAVEAGKEKSLCYHCREPHYVK